MTVTSKVRLYDLAKELKQDTKRLIEEVRREGVDVSVPSNSISKELADKIRNRYFPKKEASAPRKVVVVKKARPVAEEAPAVEETGDVTEAPEETPMPAELQPAPAETVGTQAPATAVRQIRKLTPAVRAEHPSASASASAPAAEPSPEAEPSSLSSVDFAEPPIETVDTPAPVAAEQMPEAPPVAAAPSTVVAQPPQQQQPAPPP
ncbi:MAG TPA: translation initiation factor IF-2 N-terminal domain-containing protein, partial [Pyrinomonadaceae bacterium]|nr:translation initiation factor IF-2 N-terminal domain-containing protein [Pyrinomonadaceae bacterium]